MDSQEVVQREEQYWSAQTEFDWIEENSIEDVLRFLPPMSGDVLELCTGSGMFTRHIPLDFKSYICLDLSQPMLDALKIKLPQFQVVKDNAEAPNFPEASFDTVLVFAGLHHLPNMELAISNSYRLLKENGSFFCFEPNNACLYRKPMLSLRDWIGVWTDDERFINPTHLKSILSRAGFRDIEDYYLTPRYKNARLNIVTSVLAKMMYWVSHLSPRPCWQSFFIMTAKKKYSAK